MAVSALIFAPIGAYLAKYVPTEALMIVFAIAVIIAAIRMILTSKQAEP